MHTFESLRQKHPRISFDRYSYQLDKGNLSIDLCYTLHPDIPLTTSYIFPHAKEVDHLDPFIANLGIIELLSYWKTACPPEIQIQAYHLDPEQRAWWHHLLLNGMGEFFYTNNINFTPPDFVTFTTQGPTVPPVTTKPSKNALLGIGGGKDSLLSLNLLNQHNVPFTPLMINPTPKAIEIAALSPVPPLIINRTLDSRLLELNRSGYLNGHIPFSAVFAFVSLLSAHIYEHQDIIVSNEQSANVSSTTFYNLPINHQYSKSFAFEQAFNQYASTHISPSYRYISLLRPLNELQIARSIAAKSEYFGTFVSCNVKGAQGTYCLQCPKCAFTTLIMAAFVKPSKLKQIFGKNMLDDPGSLPIFKSLLALTTHKPLDCIGTETESGCASLMAINQYDQSHTPLPPVLRVLKNSLSPLSEKECRQLLLDWNQDHLLPTNYEAIVRHELESFHSR